MNDETYQGDDRSEFMCEVVQVAAVYKHPNADKLVILELNSVKGRLAYRVVDRVGRNAGDIVAYLSVDTVVPTSRPEFKFLKDRQDGANKDYFRIRAARLRGVYSEGLVVDAPFGFVIGDSLKDHFEVTYHNPDVGGGNLTGPTPPKPKNDWRRNVVPEYGVVSLKKVPFLFDRLQPVAVTEKVHGTNFRFGWALKKHGLWPKYEWIIGSHRTFKSDNRPLWTRIVDKVLGRSPKVSSWYGNDIWSEVAAKAGLREESREYQGIVFYGEIYGVTYDGKQIQSLTYGRTTPGLLLFDAYDTENRTWLTRAQLVVAAKTMGLTCVPHLATLYYNLDVIRELAEGPSCLFPGHTREGVVVEPVFRIDGTKGKWVGEGYRLTQAKEK